MLCQKVDGVFNRHAVEHLMTSVGHEPVDRADQPFGGVGDVGQGVLDRALAFGMIVGIDGPIGRAVRGRS